MIYVEPRWDKFFLVITAVGPQNDISRTCVETKVWGDSVEELEEYADKITPIAIQQSNPTMVEYLIWKGKVTSNKKAVKQWAHIPSLMKLK